MTFFVHLVAAVDDSCSQVSLNCEPNGRILIWKIQDGIIFILIVSKSVDPSRYKSSVAESIALISQGNYLTSIFCNFVVMFYLIFVFLVSSLPLVLQLPMR